MTTGATSGFNVKLFPFSAENINLVGKGPEDVFRYFGEKNFFTVYEGCVA